MFLLQEQKLQSKLVLFTTSNNLYISLMKLIKCFYIKILCIQTYLILFHWFERVWQRKRTDKKERLSTHWWFTPTMSCTSRLGLGQDRARNQGLHLSLPSGWERWAPVCSLPARKLMKGSWARRVRQDSTSWDTAIPRGV